MHKIIGILSILILSALVLNAPSAQAYPEFIGYGYKSCLTCHWNGHGSGPLNDYGRGVWASEIASRSLYPKSWKLEDLSASSGFLGSKEIPYWIRPHLKYRMLQLGTGIRSEQQKFRYVPMQLDIGAALSLDHDNRWMAILTTGYVPNAETRETKSMNRLLPREYYLRLQVFEPLFIYLGKTDKVFGIRNIDHMAFNRLPLELTQYAQTLGAVAHYIQDKYEVSAQVFTGDPQMINSGGDPAQEQKGFTGMVEFDPLENGRVGVSGLSSKNDAGVNMGLLSAHWRQGLAKGNAVEFEVGTISRKNTATRTATNGTYSLAQSMIKLTRGFHLLTNIERYNADVDPQTPEQWKVGFGALWFPINRFEIRMNFQQLRVFSATTSNEDTWTAQGQLHVSL